MAAIMFFVEKRNNTGFASSRLEKEDLIKEDKICQPQLFFQTAMKNCSCDSINLTVPTKN